MRMIVSTPKAAEELLEKTGAPMHYRQITDLILQKCNLHGKTPYETVRASIGNSPKFVRIAEGIYALSKWKEYKQARFAKDIAYDILKTKGEPMSLYDLGLKILEERKFKAGPKLVVKSAIRNDMRFYYDKKSNLIYLVEWKI